MQAGRELFAAHKRFAQNAHRVRPWGLSSPPQQHAPAAPQSSGGLSCDPPGFARLHWGTWGRATPDLVTERSPAHHQLLPIPTRRKSDSHTGWFRRLCRGCVWLRLITTCGTCRAAGFMGGKLPPVHVSSTHTLALS